MVYVIIGLTIMLGVLGYKLYQKQKIDKSELEHYLKLLDDAEKDLDDTKKECDKEFLLYEKYKQDAEYEKYKLEECKKDLQAALDVYQEMTETRLNEINSQMDEQRQQRQTQLDDEYKTKSEYYKKLLDDTIHECEKQAETIKQATAEIEEQCKQKCDEYYWQVAHEQEKFESIQRVLQQYEAEKQSKLYYTIQLPEEYYDDIEFLLTTVAAKVQHPDIVSKLVWNEYVKDNLAATCTRVDIREEPGIYKLTSLIDGKAYIGKSTNIKRRIQDHFKSVVGIASISDQAVHHAIRKEGFWNWTIEVVTYCNKERLSELERYYIGFFKTQEFGYNKTGGG